MGDVSEISDLRSRIESLEAENGRLARALSERTTAASGPAGSSLARVRLAEAERRLDETTVAFHSANQRAESAEQVLRDVVGSLSWRITAPLRGLKRRLRRTAS